MHNSTVQRQSAQQQQHSSHNYSSSPSNNQQKPPSHPNSFSAHPQRSKFYPRTQPRQNKSKQQHSPAMPSPPILRKQGVNKEYPTSNLFQSHAKSPRQYVDDFGEGFEVEAQQYVQNPARVPSPYESPSDEILVEDGYYEDEIQHHNRNDGNNGQYQTQNNIDSGYYGQQHESERVIHSTHEMQQQPLRQSERNVANQMREQQFTIPQHHDMQQASLNEGNHAQPDWHQLNQNRLYKKKFAARYQNAATNSSPKFQTKSLPESQIRSSPTKQPNIANFSPIESLSHRTDQIQRKQRKPSQNRGFEVTDSFEDIQNEFNNCNRQPEEGEESVASVLDRARSFEASYARKYMVESEQPRSKSVPRERAQQQPPSNMHQSFNASERYPDSSGHTNRRLSQDSHFVDDDTVTESVASRKKEWEGRLQSGKQKQVKLRQPPENQAFSVWSERANRLAQQRLSEQKTEQQKQRTEQRKNIEEKWRRSAAKSMSPERSRGMQQEQYGYQSEFSASVEYHGDYQYSSYQHPARYYGDQPSIEQDSTHMSIEDRRRMLWDGKERLRAVLPRDSSFDGANAAPENSSPGTVTSSQGSSFFKSKFVHAAAVAAQQRANIEVNEHAPRRVSPKSHMHKAGAVSSHYTDSTAGTTPVDSNGSSHRTASTNISRMSSQVKSRSGSARAPAALSGSNNGERAQSAGPVSKVSVMPPIAEGVPRSSVADLIARINAVSRVNPAEALAAIDSIIKAESGTPGSRNVPLQQPVKAVQSPFSPRHPSPSNQVQPLKRDFYQTKYEEVLQDTANHDDEEEDDDDESYLSSEESTVSSMTNPTYQSISVNKSPTESETRRVKNLPQFSPPIMEELEVKSKGTRESSTSQRRQTTQSNPAPQREDGIVVSKPSSDSREDRGDRKFVETSIGGLNYRLSNSKSDDQTVPRNSSHLNKQHTSNSLNTPVKSHDDELDSSWVPVPKNDFFSSGNVNKNKSTPSDRQRANVNKNKSTPSDRQRAASEQGASRSKYLSDTELSQGQTTGLPSVVSDAFSGIDIDLDDEPASTSVQQQSQHSITSRTFSAADVEPEPKKTVRQRRQELEYLAKSWGEKSPGDQENDFVKHSSTSPHKQSSSKNANQYDWATTPEEEKKKTKAEPTLRLKGSKKLAQKFANLVKAFESD